MIGLYSEVFLFLLCYGIWTSIEAETTGRFDKGAIIVNLFDKKAKKSYLKYFKPADGFEHEDRNFNFTDWISGKGDEEFWGLTADYQAQKIFWNEYKQKRLYEYDALTGTTQTVLKYSTAGLDNLAYDRVTKVLYWTDTRMNAIFATEKSYKYITQITSTGILKPRAIAIHPTERKMIYSVYFLTVQTLHMSQIVKCDLDGKRARSIVAFPDVVRVVAITIDIKDNRIVWVDQTLDDTSIVQSSDMKGLSRSQILASKRSVFVDITRYQSFYAVADAGRYKSRYDIHIQYKKSTKESTSVKTRLLPRNVASFVNDKSDETQITNECAKTKCGHICLASSKRKSKCKCHTGYRLIRGKACVTDFVDGDHFLVLDRGNRKIFQFEFTKSNEEKLSPKAYPMKGKSPADVTAFAVDEINGDLLYYDVGRRVFVVWNKVELPFSEGNDYNKVLYMQVDSCNKILYWNTEQIIYKWKINGSSFSVIHRTRSSRFKINRFVLDTDRSSLFWTEYDEIEDIGYVMQLKHERALEKRLFQTSEALHAIFLSREMNSLLVTAKSSGALFSVDLETIDLAPEKRRIYREDLTDDAGHITSIQDFVVVNEQMYLVDQQWASLLRLTWKGAKLESIVQYGRERLFFPTAVAFVNQTKLAINSGYSDCPRTPKSTQIPTIATVTQSSPITSRPTSSTTTTTATTTTTTTATTVPTTTPPPTTTTTPPPTTTTQAPTATTTGRPLSSMQPATTTPFTMSSTTPEQTILTSTPSTTSTAFIDAPDQINSACDIILQFPGSEEEKQKAFELCRMFSVA